MINILNYKLLKVSFQSPAYLEARQVANACFCLSLAGICSLQANKNNCNQVSCWSKSKKEEKTAVLRDIVPNFSAADTCYWYTAGRLKVKEAVVQNSLAAQRGMSINLFHCGLFIR